MNLPRHSKSLFIQELVKIRACFYIKSHELCLIMAVSLTDKSATEMIDTGFLNLDRVLFWYSISAFPKFL